jgi:hypothetical protein
MTRRRVFTIGAVALAIASPSGATVALGTTTITCKAKLAATRDDLRRARANWHSSFAAYQDAVDHIENARPLLRRQILSWRHQGLSWASIKASPIGRAFYGQLYGS